MRRIITLVLGAALAASCGVPVDSEPIALDTESLPPGLSSTTTTTLPEEEPTGIEIALFLIGEDGRLDAVDRSFATPVTSQAVVEALIAAADEPELVEQQQLVSAIPSTTTVLGVERMENILVVNLGEEGFAEITEPEQRLRAVAQFVYTLTGLESVDAILFEIAGERRQVPTDGDPTEEPVDREDFRTLG